MNKKINMAQIPYIEHEYRMYKAYQREKRLKDILNRGYRREKRLKNILIATNIIWAVIALILVAG